ncbi:unnamed protein product [Cochlearia groenlandica]
MRNFSTTRHSRRTVRYYWQSCRTPAFITMVEHFETLLEYFTEFRIKATPRARNLQADKLARFGRAIASTLEYVSELPPSSATNIDSTV